MTALLDVLASNRAASSNERATVTVLIGDNGLFLSKFGAFGDPILKTTEEEHGHLDVYHEAITPIQAGSPSKKGASHTLRRRRRQRRRPAKCNQYCLPGYDGGKIHDGLSNIIAVGALDGDLGLAEISNSGPQWVDIGAPGCAIPVLSYDNNKKLWNIQKLHGTSLAAPIVSFAAALIKSESGNWSPALIKGRLLASADLSPALVSKIADGRILNISKALSLWHDVLEVRETVIRGKVELKQNGKLKSEKDTVDFTCRGLPVSVPPRNILKLVPNFTNLENKRVLKMYYRPKDGTAEFENVECDMSAGILFTLTDPDSNQTRDFNFDQVKDYVRRAF